MQDTPIVDGLVSEVRIVSTRHALFDQVLPVLAMRSARGPKFVLVSLPDGRKRSIPRSITDLGREPFRNHHDSIEESLRISVRTLLPLAHFLAARSSAPEGNGDERAASLDADASDSSGAQAIGIGAAAAAAVEGTFGERQEPTGGHYRRDGQAHGVRGSRGAE